MRLHAPFVALAALALLLAASPVASAHHAPSVCSDMSPGPVTPSTPPLSCSLGVYCPHDHVVPCVWDLYGSLAGEAGVAHLQTSWGPGCLGAINCSTLPATLTLAPGAKTILTCNSGPLTNLAGPTWGVWMRCLAQPK